IVLEGSDLAGIPIHRRAHHMGRSFQVPRLVPEFTALENVVARLDHVMRGASEAERQAAGRRQLAALGLSQFTDLPLARIGLGHHKMIELARAAAGEPALLLLDEPAVGLTADEVERLAGVLRFL